MSAAPAASAAVHISSSARRWVQTMHRPGNSLESCCTSLKEIDSTSRIARAARWRAMLCLNSSNDRTEQTQRNEPPRELSKDCAIPGSLWRRTTFCNCMTFPFSLLTVVDGDLGCENSYRHSCVTGVKITSGERPNPPTCVRALFRPGAQTPQAGASHSV